MSHVNYESRTFDPGENIRCWQSEPNLVLRALNIAFVCNMPILSIRDCDLNSDWTTGYKSRHGVNCHDSPVDTYPEACASCCW